MAYLASQVPELDGDLALGHFAHVEANRRDHVLTKRARGDDIHKRGFARVLEPDQGQLHLLVEKQAVGVVDGSHSHARHVSCTKPS